MAERTDLPLNKLEENLERLTLRKTRIEQTIKELKADNAALHDEIFNLKQEITRRRKKKDQEDPRISSHALLRYVERILEIDIELIKNHILSPANRAAIEAGATKITVDGIVLVIQDKTIVTVLNN